MKLILLIALLLPLLHAQTLCPVLQGSQCTDTCIQWMQREVDISADASDYKNFLKTKYEEFIWSDCHDCIYIFCGFVQQSYGISMAKDTCT